MKNVAISKLIITLKAKKWFSEKAQMHCLADLWLPLHINICLFVGSIFFPKKKYFSFRNFPVFFQFEIVFCYAP